MSTRPSRALWRTFHQVIQNLKSLVIRLDDDVEEATLEILAKEAGLRDGLHDQRPGLGGDPGP